MHRGEVPSEFYNHLHCSIDLHIRPGQLVAVVGHVGSGKTSLTHLQKEKGMKLCSLMEIMETKGLETKYAFN